MVEFPTRPTVRGAGVALQNETIQEVLLTADVPNANATANTLADVAGLSFSVLANTTYRFRFMVLFDAAATTTGARWTLNGPTAALLGYKATTPLTTATERTEYMNTYNAGSPAASSALVTGNIAVIEGVIRPSVAGTVVLRFASEVASSAITVKAGSALEIW